METKNREQVKLGRLIERAAKYGAVVETTYFCHRFSCNKVNKVFNTTKGLFHFLEGFIAAKEM